MSSMDETRPQTLTGGGGRWIDGNGMVAPVPTTPPPTTCYRVLHLVIERKAIRRASHRLCSRFLFLQPPYHSFLFSSTRSFFRGSPCLPRTPAPQPYRSRRLPRILVAGGAPQLGHSGERRLRRATCFADCERYEAVASSTPPLPAYLLFSPSLFSSSLVSSAQPFLFNGVLQTGLLMPSTYLGQTKVTQYE